MKIQSISVRHADRSIWGHLAEREKTLPLVTPLDIYPQFQHAYGITHIHLALAFPVVPMVEYFPLPCWDHLPGAEVEPIFHDEPVPSDGHVSLPARPGLGVTVNERIF